VPYSSQSINQSINQSAETYHQSVSPSHEQSVLIMFMWIIFCCQDLNGILRNHGQSLLSTEVLDSVARTTLTDIAGEHKLEVNNKKNSCAIFKFFHSLKSV